MEIGLTVRCEQSWWMKGICLIWFRGRHFSLSLPDRGPTQGRGPIRGPRSRGYSSCYAALAPLTGSYVFVLFSKCPRYFVSACTGFQNYACAGFQNCGEENEGSNKLDPRIYAAFPLGGECRHVKELYVCNLSYKHNFHVG